MSRICEFHTNEVYTLNKWKMGEMVPTLCGAEGKVYDFYNVKNHKKHGLTGTTCLCKEHFEFVKDCLDRGEIEVYKERKSEVNYLCNRIKKEAGF